MEVLVTVGKLLLVALAVAGVAHPLLKERRNYEFIWQVLKRFRFGLFVQAFGVLLAVVAVGFALYTYVPVLKYGWLNLFFDNGGNLFIRPIQDGSKSSSEFIRFLPVLFFVVLMVVLPFMAKTEEEMFRKGHDEWKDIVWQSVKFGLVHCFVGIPLAFGIALILTGLFYGQKYKRSLDRNVRTLGYSNAQDEAVMASTTAHTMCNTIVVTLLLVVALVAL